MAYDYETSYFIDLDDWTYVGREVFCIIERKLPVNFWTEEFKRSYDYDISTADFEVSIFRSDNIQDCIDRLSRMTNKDPKSLYITSAAKLAAKERVSLLGEV